MSHLVWNLTLGEWLYRIAPKNTKTHKPYHDDNVGTQSAGTFMLILLIVSIPLLDKGFLQVTFQATSFWADLGHVVYHQAPIALLVLPCGYFLERTALRLDLARWKASPMNNLALKCIMNSLCNCGYLITVHH